MINRFRLWYHLETTALILAHLVSATAAVGSEPVSEPAAHAAPPSPPLTSACCGDPPDSTY